MRNTIYKIMMAVFFLSLMAADSPSLLPIASLAISGTWLTAVEIKQYRRDMDV